MQDFDFSVNSDHFLFQHFFNVQSIQLFLFIINTFFLFSGMCLVVVVVVVVAAFVLVLCYLSTSFLLVIISASLAFCASNVTFGRISISIRDIHARLCELNYDIFYYYHIVSSMKIYIQFLY